MGGSGVARLLLLCLVFPGCRGNGTGSGGSATDGPPGGAGPGGGGPADAFREVRRGMVRQLRDVYGIKDGRVLRAMEKVERDRFVPEEIRSRAYEDAALPIGLEQTISQPYIVAVMTELLQLDGTEKVLEIGTGSGYQAAVLAETAGEVYTIEILDPLARRAEADLKAAGYSGVHVRSGDGYRGWPEAAPFDAIIVTAAPDHVPQPLVDQLKVGGRMVIPVGSRYQDLVLLRKTEKEVLRREVLPVRFVPMTGEAEKK